MDGRDIEVLMSMNHQSGLRFVQIRKKCFEALVDFLIALVNSRWGVVGHKNIYLWKRPHHGSSFRLLEQMMSSWLIAPTARKASETNAFESSHGTMQLVLILGKEKEAAERIDS